MEKQDRKEHKHGLPDTTQKKAGTTSAFSAASDRESGEPISEERKRYLEDGEQGRASFVSGTTTQAGSNYGQGSAALGPSSYKQGSEQTEGASYANESGRFAETGLHAGGVHEDPEEMQDAMRRQGGTDAEHDNLQDKDETLGIP